MYYKTHFREVLAARANDSGHRIVLSATKGGRKVTAREIGIGEKERIVLRLTRVWLWAVLVGLPLVVHDGYFDVTEIKTAWYAVCAVLLLMGRLVCAIQFGRSGRRETGAAGIFAAVFCFAALLASIGSGFLRDSLFGPQGRWQGAAMLWLYAAVWASLRDVPLRTEDVTIPLFIGMGAAALLAIADHLGFDLLGMQSALGPFDRGRYISVLGNINFAGAYFVLTTGTVAYSFAAARTGGERAAYGGLFALSLWGAMAVRSECAVLGVSAALAALPFAFRDRDALSRGCLIGAAAILLMQLYRLIAALFGAGLSSLTGMLLRPECSAAVILLSAAVYAISRRVKETGRFRRGLGLAMAAAALLVTAGLILLNTAFSHVPLGAAEEWLRFSDAWGTDRLGVWKHCLALRRSFGPWEKLMGGGCGILARMDARDRIFPDAVLDAAHCEYLQILLNWGWAGLLSWCAWPALSVREGLKNGGALSRVLIPGLIGYAVQAAVNIAQAPGIMIFFAMLAAQRSSSGKMGKAAVDKDDFCGKIQKL